MTCSEMTIVLKKTWTISDKERGGGGKKENKESYRLCVLLLLFVVDVAVVLVMVAVVAAMVGLLRFTQQPVGRPAMFHTATCR